MGMIEESDEFLRRYEAEMGDRVVNLDFWKLAAVARPMTDIAGWITDSEKGVRFRHFIADAIDKVGY
jgi:hypothetical protein